MAFYFEHYVWIKNWDWLVLQKGKIMHFVTDVQLIWNITYEGTLRRGGLRWKH